MKELRLIWFSVVNKLRYSPFSFKRFTLTRLEVSRDVRVFNMYVKANTVNISGTIFLAGKYTLNKTENNIKINDSSCVAWLLTDLGLLGTFIANNFLSGRKIKKNEEIGNIYISLDLDFDNDKWPLTRTNWEFNAWVVCIIAV